MRRARTVRCGLASSEGVGSALFAGEGVQARSVRGGAGELRHVGRFCLRFGDGGEQFAQRAGEVLAERRLEGAQGADLACQFVLLALEVGEQVRDARETAGLSQRELAARMGTSQAAIARLEAGGVGATLTTLQKVATALQLEVSVLLRPAS